MNRFNLQAVKQFWAIAKLYWLGNEKFGVLGLFLSLGVLLLANTQVKVFLNTLQGDLISALAAGNDTLFWQGILFAFIWIIIFGLLNSGFGYLRDTIGLYWRRWLTHHLLKQYFRDRAFYNLSNFQKQIDNPDQRIAEDIANFCQQSMQFLVNIIESIFVAFAFSLILWSISPNLVFALIIYSILLSGDLEVGKVTEAGGAFGQVTFSVNLIMYQFEKFTKFAASINRLYVFSEYFQQPRKEIANGNKINIIQDSRFAIQNLTLQTPLSPKTLFKDLSVAVQSGEGLLIMGESGCGKSSLLRAIAL